MSKFQLPVEYLPAICEECPCYDEDTGECIASESFFGECALLAALIIPEFGVDDLDETEDSD